MSKRTNKNRRPAAAAADPVEHAIVIDSYLPQCRCGCTDHTPKNGARIVKGSGQTPGGQHYDAIRISYCRCRGCGQSLLYREWLNPISFRNPESSGDAGDDQAASQ